MKLRAAQRVRRDVELARDGIDQPLDQIGRLRPPGAAIGIDRHRVGVDDAQAHMRRPGCRRRPVAMPTPSQGMYGAIGRQIGAHVGDDVDLEREETALVVERELRGRDIVAAVAVGEEMLGAVGDPFHRLAQALARRPRRAHIRDRETAWCRSRRRHRA